MIQLAQTLRKSAVRQYKNGLDFTDEKSVSQNISVYKRWFKMDTELIYVIVFAVAGLFLCLFGYSLRRIPSALLGATVGITVAALAIVLLSGSTLNEFANRLGTILGGLEHDLLDGKTDTAFTDFAEDISKFWKSLSARVEYSTVILILGVIIGALIGAALYRAVFSLSVFVLVLGFMAYDGTNTLELILSIIAAAAAYFIYDILYILSAAASGSGMIVYYCLPYVLKPNTQDSETLKLIAAAIAVASVIIQICALRHERRQSKADA